MLYSRIVKNIKGGIKMTKKRFTAFTVLTLIGLIILGAGFSNSLAYNSSSSFASKGSREKLHTFYYGDINRNGVVEINDAILVLRYITGLEKLSTEQLNRAKVRGKEDIDVLDAVTILRVIVGLKKEFPVEQETDGTLLELKTAEYITQYNINYQYDTPILIESYAQWQEFVVSHPNFYNGDALQHYDENYFEDSIIYAYVKKEPNYGVSLKVYKSIITDDILELFMVRNVPKVVAPLEETLICLFGLNRNDIQNIESVRAIILE